MRDQQNQCPGSEEAAADRVFACAIALLGGAWALLKTLGSVLQAA